MADDGSAVRTPVNCDVEIHSIAQDRLGRAPFARRVAERIATAGDGPSVVFGLAGPWGAGKTSLLNMVDQQLRENHGKHWSVVRFTPWSAADLAALTDEFYMAIAAAMPRNKKGKRAAGLLTMAPVIAAAGKAAAVSAIESRIGPGAVKDVAEAAAEAAADQAGEFRLKPDPFVQRFNKLSCAIDETGRNVLVIVDDVDRLHAEELLSVMKAIRLLGRFNRVHYLLSYDERTVLDVLQSSDIANGDESRARHYLEKIVQYPFALPPLQTKQVESVLHSALDAVAAAHDIELTQHGGGNWGTIARVIDTLPDTDVESLTLRGINRLASQVDVLLTLVGSNEINFADATLLTFLRLSYPALYQMLPRWQKDLTGEARLYSAPGRLREPSREDWHKRVADALSIASEQRDGNPDLDSLLRLLERLFPRTAQQIPSSDADPRCIHQTDYFDRYFAFGIPPGDVRDATVRQELSVLSTTGELPVQSVIRDNFDDFLGRARILRKVLRNLDVIASARSSHASDAAIYLNRQLGEGDRIYGGWASVLYALLGHAVCTAESAQDARRTIERFVNEFGLLATAEVLAYKVELPTIDPARVIEASKPIRADVIEACRRDLVSDVCAENPDTLTNLHFARYLDEALIGELSNIAKKLITDGAAKAYELAGRFVVLRPAERDGMPPERTHYLESFERLVPQDMWILDEIPEYDESEVAPGDGSLENRIRFVAVVMRQILNC